MRQPTKASGLWTCSLAIATLFGCGVFDTQRGNSEVELMSILKTDSGVDALVGLEASYCSQARCAIAVPVGWSGEPGAIGIGPLGEKPVVGMPCPNSPSGPIGFTAVTCRNPAGEAGLALCLQTMVEKGSAIWGPCATTNEELARSHYLEAFMILARPLYQLFARKQAAVAPATPTVASGSWPAGPAKVCVAVAPNRGVQAFAFSVTTRGGVASTSTQGQGGVTSNPLCVDVAIPPGTTSIVVRTTASAGESTGSCAHSFTSPDDEKSLPACTGAFAATNRAVVAVAADTESRFGPVYERLVTWLGASAQ